MLRRVVVDRPNAWHVEWPATDPTILAASSPPLMHEKLPTLRRRSRVLDRRTRAEEVQVTVSC